MPGHVEIEFDCWPLRLAKDLRPSPEASPKFLALCERLQAAIGKHGTHNAYYLHRASCRFFVSNSPERGMIEFLFEGTVLTDPADQRAIGSDLTVELKRETVDWLVQPAVDWFAKSVSYAVRDEFDRYIAAGDLAAAVTRLEQSQSQSDERGGYLGMGL